MNKPPWLPPAVGDRSLGAKHISGILPVPLQPLPHLSTPPFSVFPVYFFEILHLFCSFLLQRSVFTEKIIPILDLQTSVYLCFFSGVPEKREGIERNLLDITNAAVYFFVVSWKRKYHMLFIFSAVQVHRGLQNLRSTHRCRWPSALQSAGANASDSRSGAAFLESCHFQRQPWPSSTQETNGYRKQIRYKAGLKGIR